MSHFIRREVPHAPLRLRPRARGHPGQRRRRSERPPVGALVSPAPAAVQVSPAATHPIYVFGWTEITLPPGLAAQSQGHPAPPLGPDWIFTLAWQRQATSLQNFAAAGPVTLECRHIYLVSVPCR